MRRVNFTVWAFLAAAGCASAPEGSWPDGEREDPSRLVERYPGEPIEVMIQRTAPGVIVRKTGNGIAFEIRSSALIPNENANPAPHFVVNGLPFEAGPNGELAGIEPSEIESIKVLKGAEAAIYGIHGANGVIVIKTKKGPTKSNH